MATVAALGESSVSSANFRNNLPDAVSETFPPERSSNLAPTSSSIERICEEIAGWVRKRFSAAREKLDRRETSINVSNWSKSIKNQALVVRLWALGLSLRSSGSWLSYHTPFG